MITRIKEYFFGNDPVVSVGTNETDNDDGKNEDSVIIGEEEIREKRKVSKINKDVKKSLGILSNLPGDVFIYHIFRFVDVESILKSVRYVSSQFFNLSVKSLNGRRMKYGCYDIFVNYDAPILRSLIDMNTLDLSYDGEDIFDELRRSVHINRDKLILLFESPDWEAPMSRLRSLYQIYGIDLIVGIIGNSRMSVDEKCEYLKSTLVIDLHQISIEDRRKKQRNEQVRGMFQLLEQMDEEEEEDRRKTIEFIRKNYLNIPNPLILDEFLENPLIYEVCDLEYYERLLEVGWRDIRQAREVIYLMIKENALFPHFNPSQPNNEWKPFTVTFLNGGKPVLQNFLKYTLIMEKYSDWKNLFTSSFEQDLEHEETAVNNLSRIYDDVLRPDHPNYVDPTFEDGKLCQVAIDHKKFHLLRLICGFRSHESSWVSQRFNNWFEEKEDILSLILAILKLIQECGKLESIVLENEVLVGKLREDYALFFRQLNSSSRYDEQLSRKLIRSMTNIDIENLSFDVLELLAMNEDIRSLELLVSENTRLFMKKYRKLILEELVPKLHRESKIYTICFLTLSIRMTKDEIIQSPFKNEANFILEVFRQVDVSEKRENCDDESYMEKCCSYILSKRSFREEEDTLDVIWSEIKRVKVVRDQFSSFCSEFVEMNPIVKQEDLHEACAEKKKDLVALIISSSSFGNIIKVTHETLLSCISSEENEANFENGEVIELVMKSTPSILKYELGNDDDGRVFRFICRYCHPSFVRNIILNLKKKNETPFGKYDDGLLMMIKGTHDFIRKTQMKRRGEEVILRCDCCCDSELWGVFQRNLEYLFFKTTSDCDRLFIDSVRLVGQKGDVEVQEEYKREIMRVCEKFGGDELKKEVSRWKDGISQECKKGGISFDYVVSWREANYY